ncbi:MAG: autotransporter-associated beta strand repeat-containing protein, partial [Thermoguttaceae bacterium]
AVSGSWSDSTKWANGVVPNAAGVWAVISASTTATLTVTLDTPQTVGTLVLGSGNPGVGYIISGSGSNTLTLSNLGSGATITVTDGSHVINAPVVLADNLVVTSGGTNAWTLAFGAASSITDNGGGYSLTMNGAGGTLLLSGSNTYTGGTTVSAGVLTYLTRAAQPASGMTNVAAGATLGLGVSNTNTAYFGATDLDNLFAGTMPNVTSDPNSNVGIDTTAGNFTYASNIPYTTMGLTKLGPNTLTLTGANAYTGLTTVSGGTLQLGDGTSGDDASLNTSGIVNNAALAYNVFGSQTANYPIAGSGSLTKLGTGTLTLSGSGYTYSGNTFLTSGTIVMNTGVPSSSVVMSSNTTLDLSAPGLGTVALGSLADAPGSPTGHQVLLGVNTLETGLDNSSTTFSGAISDGGNGGSLIKTGTGTFTLAGVNTYTGGTTINSGVLTFLTRVAQPGSGTTTVAAGATLGLGVGPSANLYGSADLDNLFAGTMPNVTRDPNSNVGIDTTAGSFTYSSNIPATTMGLTKLGPNTLTLTGSNAYSGLTTVSGGTLQLGDGTAGHDGSIAGDITNNSALVYNLNGNQTYAGSISGNGNVTKAGPGTLTLANANTYAGSTYITAGTVKLHYIAPSTAAPPVPGYAYWFDASQLTGCNNGDNVSAWPNLGSAGGTAQVNDAHIPPTYIANAGTGTALPALAFSAAPGGYGDGTSGALQFPEDSNIRTVFSIFKGASFLLTDAASGQYNFHRGGAGFSAIDGDPTAPLWNGPNWANWASSYITGGTTSVNGVVANYSTTDMPVLASQNGYNLVALQTTGPVIADSFNEDRDTGNSGNQSQAEVLIYNTPLTASQMAATEAYLNTKWFATVPNILPSTS